MLLCKYVAPLKAKTPDIFGYMLLAFCFCVHVMCVHSKDKLYLMNWRYKVFCKNYQKEK